MRTNFDAYAYKNKREISEHAVYRPDLIYCF